MNLKAEKISSQALLEKVAMEHFNPTECSVWNKNDYKSDYLYTLISKTNSQAYFKNFKEQTERGISLCKYLKHQKKKKKSKQIYFDWKCHK